MALFYPHMLDAPPCPALPSALQQMKAFWLPSLAPETKALLEKPDMATYCPASGKKLSLKQLISLKFTP